MSKALFLSQIFIVGAVVGSFLNVIIYRLPKEEDFVWKRSYCPHCGNPIPFYLNIPIISFIFLLGKCFSFKERISARYPFVELLTGLYFVYTWPLIISTMGIVNWVILLVIFSILICHFFIDIDYHILPDRLNLILLVFSLVYAFLFLNWKSSLIGGAVGFIFPYLISYLFYKIKGVEGLGGGDIKLWGILGILLGAMGIIENIFFSSLLGSLIAGGTIALGKKDKSYAFAFGPYIILSYIIQFHFSAYIPSFLKLF